MAGIVGALFGGNKRAAGPSAGEKALQQERRNDAVRSDAEGDAKVALAKRAGSLRQSLGYRDEEKKGSLGG
jgi:hypothetical protein